MIFYNSNNHPYLVKPNWFFVSNKQIHGFPNKRPIYEYMKAAKYTPLFELIIIDP